MKKIKFIKRQDSGFKLSYGNSGETSLNLSNEIFDFISQGTLSPGDERDITFRIYKEDYIKAMSFVIMKLPLYKSSSNYSNKVDNYLDIFRELYSKIEEYFGPNKEVEYTVSLFYRTDGRIYLKGLRVNGFSIRDYLVENCSAIQFDDEGDNLINLRILSDVEENGEMLEKATMREELCRIQSAAPFLREALIIVSRQDNNLSLLAAQNKYKETDKHLKINGFNLWRKKEFLPSRPDDVFLDLGIEYSGQKYVMYREWTPADMERLFFPTFNSAYNGIFAMVKDGKEYVLYRINKLGNVSEAPSRQQIFYGAPGTGKSHEIKEQTKGQSVIRTTFHPDSDYSTFVGAYKPIMEDCDVKVTPIVTYNGVSLQPSGTYKERRIAYKFVKQAFLKAYLGAWKKYVEKEGEEATPQYLIIEEINRGNCAQIFGDLFQLLDRSANGFSEYPIEADTDMQDAIKNAFAEEDEYKVDSLNIDDVIDGYISNYDSTLSNDVREGRVLLLPPNLYIWATMNTSDQSLFPIDSAFKRRWDWIYRPIGYKNSHWTIEIREKRYNWVDFQKRINQKIYDVDNSEDKQLGDYFVNADRTGDTINADTLLNKILFYLWNDVCKDDPDQIFRWIDDKKQTESIKFSDFFGADREKKLQGFMTFNEIKAVGEPQNADTNMIQQDEEEAVTSDTPTEEDNVLNE